MDGAEYTDGETYADVDLIVLVRVEGHCGYTRPARFFKMCRESVCAVCCCPAAPLERWRCSLLSAVLGLFFLPFQVSSVSRRRTQRSACEESRIVESGMIDRVNPDPRNCLSSFIAEQLGRGVQCQPQMSDVLVIFLVIRAMLLPLLPVRSQTLDRFVGDETGAAASRTPPDRTV